MYMYKTIKATLAESANQQILPAHPLPPPYMIHHIIRVPRVELIHLQICTVREGYGSVRATD